MRRYKHGLDIQISGTRRGPPPQWWRCTTVKIWQIGAAGPGQVQALTAAEAAAGRNDVNKTNRIDFNLLELCQIIYRDSKMWEIQKS